MNLYLIRHTSVNVPKGMIYGQTDVSLSYTFEQDSKIVVEQLPIRFDAVYCSPLTRCRLLAEKISNNYFTDDRLMELNFGDWEAKLWDDIETSSNAQQFFTDYVNTSCPNGESFVAMIDRCRLFLFDLKSSNFKNVCIVAHGGSIRAFISIIENISPDEAISLKIGYGEIVVFDNLKLI